MAVTNESFLRTVAKHEMHVDLDSGCFRHLRFERPGTYCEAFRITTWPGHLAFSGDMGTFVFTRLKDMFDFFRARESTAEALYVNFDYWAQKCCASDKTDGLMEFSPKAFKAAVVREMREARPRRETRNEIRLVLEAAEDGESAAMYALYSFYTNDDFSLDDINIRSFQDYTGRFLFCCYAIAWAILKYDEFKQRKNQ